MLPIGSIFFPLIIAPFKMWLSVYTVQKIPFDDADTNILWCVSIYCLIIV